MRAIHGLVLALALAGATGVAQAADGQGLTAFTALSAPDGMSIGTALPRWRSRMALGFSSPGLAVGGLGSDAAGAARPALAGVRLLGDYYFGRAGAFDVRAGGFRATSGLLVGLRLGTWAASGDGAATASALNIERRSFGLPSSTLDAARTGRTAVPYLGLGYSETAAQGRWGFSADVGVMALKSSSGLRYGRGAGAQTIDDVQRDLRLAPVLQLGASYPF